MPVDYTVIIFFLLLVAMMQGRNLNELDHANKGDANGEKRKPNINLQIREISRQLQAQQFRSCKDTDRRPFVFFYTAPPASNKNVFISRISFCKNTMTDTNKKAERKVPLQLIKIVQLCLCKLLANQV